MYTEEELKEVGLNDFRVFLAFVWEFLRLPEPTKVQLDIAHYLQHGPVEQEGKQKRMIIEAFRGVGKSWITVAFVCWILLLDPQKKVMVVSAGEGLAGDFTKFSLQLIRGMPLLQHLAPDPSKGQKASTEKFDVGPARENKDASVKSVGITGNLPGARADVIIMDDIETPKNSYTTLLRERLFKLVEEPDNILKPLPTSRIIYLGTPQVEQSVYVRLHRERGFAVRIWPAEVPESAERYGGNLAPMVRRMMAQGVPPGTPVEPTRFPREILDVKLAGNGAAGYALQFMLDTNPSNQEKHPLKLRDLIVHDCDDERTNIKLVWSNDPREHIKDVAAGGFDGDNYFRASFRSDEMSHYTHTVMAIDPSGNGADETAYAIVKYCHGMLYLMDCGGFVSGFGEETLKALAGKAVRWGVNDIIIETNYGGGMFNSLLKPHLIKVKLDREETIQREGLPPERVRHGKIDEEWKSWSKGVKEFRILDTLEPVVKNHKLVINRAVIEADLAQQRKEQKYSLFYQFTRMQRLKGALAHEDRLEVVSMACGYFTEKMSRDQDRAVKDEQNRLLDAALKRHMRNVVGRGKPSRTKWEA